MAAFHPERLARVADVVSRRFQFRFRTILINRRLLCRCHTGLDGAIGVRFTRAHAAVGDIPLTLLNLVREIERHCDSGRNHGATLLCLDFAISTIVLKETASTLISLQLAKQKISLFWRQSEIFTDERLVIQSCVIVE